MTMKYHLPFGTHGIRGDAQFAPFTPPHLWALGRALELFLAEKKLSPFFLIGSDTRESCSRIIHGLLAGFSSRITVVNAGILPTPVLNVLLTQQSQFGCGIMITASHNPAHDNGIKITLQQGAELTKKDELRIQELFAAAFSEEQETTAPSCTISSLQSPFGEYLGHIKPHFAPNFLSGLTIGIDCANGSTSTYAPAIFEHFGATVHPIHHEPNGSNINHACGSTHPEDLQQLVQAKNLTCGFAFDGDGDRVVGINATGELKDGDDLLVLLASNLPRTDQQFVVSTKLSNSALKKAINAHHASLVSSDVGEHAVVEEMKKHDAPLGAEPSGHIVIKKHLMSSDGIFAALSCLQAALDQNNVAFKTFTHNPHALKSIAVTHKPTLSNEPFTTIIKDFASQNPDTFQLIRYSGTEQLLRVYIEAETSIRAEDCATKLAMQLAAAINCVDDQPLQAPSRQHNQRTA